jgi:hypothetical protein
VQTLTLFRAARRGAAPKKMVTYALLFLVAIMTGAVNAMADGGGLLKPCVS